MSELSKILDAAQDTGDLTVLKLKVASQEIDIHEPLEDMSLLGFVSERGNLQLIEMLLVQGADPNFCIDDDPDFLTPLMAAAYGGNLEAVKKIVNAGANVNYVQDAGDYALALAANCGHQDIFDYLSPLTDIKLREQAEKELE